MQANSCLPIGYAQAASFLRKLDHIVPIAHSRSVTETNGVLFLVQRISVELLVIAAIGLVLGLLGPFGTYPMPLPMRLAYWIGFAIIGYAIFRPITRAAGWLHDMTNTPLIAAIMMAVAVAALPLSLLIAFAINGMQWQGYMLGGGFGLLYAQCAGIGVGIFLFMRLIFHDGKLSEFKPAEIETKDRAKPPNPDEPSPKILDRLPTGFPNQILALGVEDHYVRVHAHDRSEMLLMRLADAIDEMSGLEGMRVHRSWWVTKEAIEKPKRDGRNLRLVLINGLEIPVSRPNVTKLKQTGWI